MSASQSDNQVQTAAFFFTTQPEESVKLSAVLSRDAAPSQDLQQAEQHAALSPIGLSDN